MYCKHERKAFDNHLVHALITPCSCLLVPVLYLVYKRWPERKGHLIQRWRQDHLSGHLFSSSHAECVCVGHESCASLGGNTLPLTRSQNAPLFLRHLDFMDTQSTALSHDRLVMCMPPTWENWVLTSTSAAWCRLPWSAASWAHPAGKK